MKEKRFRLDKWIRLKGSFTVEAAIVISVVVLCVFLFVEAGIELYVGMSALVQEQGKWEEFCPAAQFRKLELLENVLNMVVW